MMQMTNDEPMVSKEVCNWCNARNCPCYSAFCGTPVILTWWGLGWGMVATSCSNGRVWKIFCRSDGGICVEHE